MLYLAVVLDLASRRVVGWATDPSLAEALTLRALGVALTLRQPAPGIIHHSDRGSHYASGKYRALLRQHGFLRSMSRVGNCWDNAVAESFFATIKKEDGACLRRLSRQAAARAVASYIDGWYNHQRRHATLGYLSPVQYERQLARLVNA